MSKKAFTNTNSNSDSSKKKLAHLIWNSLPLSSFHHQSLEVQRLLPVTILSRAMPPRAPHWNRHVPLYELAFRTPGKTYIGTTQAGGLYRARLRSTCRHPSRICPGQVY